MKPIIDPDNYFKDGGEHRFHRKLIDSINDLASVDMWNLFFGKSSEWLRYNTNENIYRIKEKHDEIGWIVYQKEFLDAVNSAPIVLSKFKAHMTKPLKNLMINLFEKRAYADNVVHNIDYSSMKSAYELIDKAIQSLREEQ